VWLLRATLFLLSDRLLQGVEVLGELLPVVVILTLESSPVERVAGAARWAMGRHGRRAAVDATLGAFDVVLLVDGVDDDTPCHTTRR